MFLKAVPTEYDLLAWNGDLLHAVSLLEWMLIVYGMVNLATYGIGYPSTVSYLFEHHLWFPVYYVGLLFVKRFIVSLVVVFYKLNMLQIVG